MCVCRVARYKRSSTRSELEFLETLGVLEKEYVQPTKYRPVQNTIQGSINYVVNADKSVKFDFVDGRGQTTTQTYTPRRGGGGGGNRPPGDPNGSGGKKKGRGQ